MNDSNPNPPTAAPPVRRAIHIEVTSTAPRIGKSVITGLVFDLLRRHYGHDRVTLHDSEKSCLFVDEMGSPKDRAAILTLPELRDVELHVIDANRPATDPFTLTPYAFKDIRYTREPENYHVIAFTTASGVKRYLHEAEWDAGATSLRWVKDLSLATKYVWPDTDDLEEKMASLVDDGTGQMHPSLQELVEEWAEPLGTLTCEQIRQEVLQSIPLTRRTTTAPAT